jgi:CRISPR-associated protein Cas5t
VTGSRPKSATLFLLLDAPFAAFRWLQAGVYRGTYPVMPHSAAWGFVLNLAGVETRGSVNEVVTPIAASAPRMELAVGVVRDGQRSTLYQQLHSYPVGNSGKDLEARAHGQKFWIAPAKREVLVGLQWMVGVRGEPSLLERIPLGLAGTLEVERYGLPFAGDNQFLFNRIELSKDDVARWYVPVEAGSSPKGSTRLTTVIDRKEASRTKAPMFAPTRTSCSCPSEAWVEVGPSTDES